MTAITSPTTNPVLASLALPGNIAITPGTTWLYTGAEGPPLAGQKPALISYLDNRALGPQGRAEHANHEAQLRGHLADLLGLLPGDVALLSNASEALNAITQSLRLQPGDNVVLNDLEYPSVVQPWLNLAAEGVEIRIARHHDWELPDDAIAALVDSRTRVLAVSHVSYLSGWRHDLPKLSTIAKSVGAFFLVDATQSLGVVPVDARCADAVVASSYKWLLGGHGVGILAWNRSRWPLPSPVSVGWRSVREIFTTDRFEHIMLHDDVRRFEVGFPSYPSIYSLLTSVTWLNNFDPAIVEAHVSALTGRLIDELKSRGLTVMTPTDAQRRAGNVAFTCRHGEQVSDLLAIRDIMTWGGDGRLRASIHLFNSTDDIDRLLSALDDPEVITLLDRT